MGLSHEWLSKLDPPLPLYVLASSHALRVCNEAFLLEKKQKNSVILFFIYNFYFDNLINVKTVKP